MVRILAFLVLFLALPLVASAEEPDAAQYQRIITQQLEAFRSDDGALAYSFAAPIIRQAFPTPDAFMAMVNRGYLPVYRAQSYKFGETLTDGRGSPGQRVTLIGPDGKTYEALYSMERQPDGSWLINGCTLLEVPGLDT